MMFVCVCRLKVLDTKKTSEARKKTIIAVARYWGRATCGAQSTMGQEWDEILEKICLSKEIEEGIRQEDFYYLSSNGLSDEWLVEAARVMLLKPEMMAESEGWGRKKPHITDCARQASFMRRVFEEGVRYLEEIKVYKSAKADRESGEPFSKNPHFTSDVLRRSFTKEARWEDLFRVRVDADVGAVHQRLEYQALLRAGESEKEVHGGDIEDGCKESNGLVSYLL
jgi:hypothetical protein